MIRRNDVVVKWKSGGGEKDVTPIVVPCFHISLLIKTVIAAELQPVASAFL